tara:strand:+ start:768 stop:1961 length:1194 start_codon:yes stop_codon:yes gene_type:complete
MIINGNSLEELKKFPDNYFHSVVTDPPYGISFMGKKWDYDVPSVELWTEVFRVLKEGGYLLSFAGTRTQHRMAVNIEDAGFEIRDMIAWVYGSGFPKSHNIGKAVDKMLGAERKVVGMRNPNRDNSIRKLRVYEGIGGEGKQGLADKKCGGLVEITEPSTQEAKKWEGWGTALKPALEPITMARKPFKTSVAENVLKNGVGGINIDACRVGNEKIETSNGDGFGMKGIYGTGINNNKGEIRNGRFPANFIHDGSDEVKDLLEESSRFFYCAKASKQDRNEGLEDFEEKITSYMATNNGTSGIPSKGMEQFTSEPKANFHPTVKPTNLMRYLVRLVTPKNGIVLDCFMGSGSTGKACALEGFEFVGIDLDKDYCKIAKARIDKALEDKKQAEAQTKLF